jgi:hypothetical protein
LNRQSSLNSPNHNFFIKQLERVTKSKHRALKNPTLKRQSLHFEPAMSKQLSSQPQPFDVPNNLLAKKLSSINSKLDAFSRELGEESTLNVLINTLKNKKIMGDYLNK